MRPLFVSTMVSCVTGLSAFVSLGACNSSDEPANTGSPDSGSETADARVESTDAGAGAEATDALPYPLNQTCAPSDLQYDECGKCAREKCCNTRDAILGNDAGAGLVACTQETGCDASEECMTACFAKFPDQVDAYLAHLTCLGHACGDTCGGNRNTCGQCIEKNCLLPSVACDMSKDCFLLTACGSACNDSESCLQTCLDRYAAASKLQTDLTVCGGNRCTTECQ